MAAILKVEINDTCTYFKNKHMGCDVTVRVKLFGIVIAKKRKFLWNDRTNSL